MIKFIVVYMTESNDLYTEEFETEEKAKEFLNELEWKSILIKQTDYGLIWEDHT